MYEELKKRVYNTNMELFRQGLIKFTWGNVSEINRELGIVAIKPSGVAYEVLSYEDIVIVDLNGKVIEGMLKPSTDLDTHLYLYKNLPLIGGIAHTHSAYATSFSQAQVEIPCFGTTHADHFNGAITVTRPLTFDEINYEYEKNTGVVIVNTLKSISENGLNIPAILVANHGPFTFGINANKAVINAIVLEEVAKMAYFTLNINQNVIPAADYLLTKHYERKNGKDSYYGQKNSVILK